MVFSSPFGPIPELPPFNTHQFVFYRPGAPDVPNHVVQIDAITGKTRTRSELLELVRLCATALASPTEKGGLGLSREKGSLVGIYSDNCLDYIVLVHALLSLAVPFALLSPFATPFELSHCLKKANPTHLFVHPSLVDRALKVGKKHGLKSDALYILEGHRSGHLSVSDFCRKAKKEKLPLLEPMPVQKDALAILFFSSGTSGLPKAVMISHDNLICSIMQFAVIGMEMMKYMPPDALREIQRSLAFLPFYHVYGLQMAALRAFLAPSTQVIMPRWNLDLAIQSLTRYKINQVVMIPSVVHTLVNSPKFMDTKLDLSNLKMAASGAAYLHPTLAEKFISRVPAVGGFQGGYGLSECTLAALGVPPPGPMRETYKVTPGSQGILLPGQLARVVREDGSDAPKGEIGELWIKGGNIAMGYYGDEEATRKSFTSDGWLKTGDRFRVDENENFFFEDRAKDTLKVSGMQVSPKEIEVFILNSEETKDLVQDVAVAGVITASSRMDDERVPRAWVVLSPHGKKVGAKDVKEKITKAVEEGLSKYKWLRGGVGVADEIPKNPTGKVLKRVLVERYEKRTGLKQKARL